MAETRYLEGQLGVVNKDTSTVTIIYPVTTSNSVRVSGISNENVGAEVLSNVLTLNDLINKLGSMAFMNYSSMISNNGDVSTQIGTWSSSVIKSKLDAITESMSNMDSQIETALNAVVNYDAKIQEVMNALETISDNIDAELLQDALTSFSTLKREVDSIDATIEDRLSTENIARVMTTIIEEQPTLISAAISDKLDSCLETVNAVSDSMTQLSDRIGNLNYRIDSIRDSMNSRMEEIETSDVDIKMRLREVEESIQKLNDAFDIS